MSPNGERMLGWNPNLCYVLLDHRFVHWCRVCCRGSMISALGKKKTCLSARVHGESDLEMEEMSVFNFFLRGINKQWVALRLVLSSSLQPSFALDMTGKRVTAFQAWKVRLIESVTVSFHLSLGLCEVPARASL